MQGFVYAIVVASLWGLAALVECSIIKQVSPLFLYVIGGLCFGISALVMLAFKRATLIPMFLKASPRVLFLSVLSSVAAIVVANYLFLLALDRTTRPTIVTALAYCAPVFTLIGAIVLLQYKVSPLELAGIAMTLFGVLIIAISIKTN
jgi:drug/metabolite transporter (DMT)-like permease